MFKYKRTRARKPERVLAAAADLIEEVGWYQGTFVEPGTGRVCALGALNAVISGDPGFLTETLKVAGPAYDLLLERTAADGRGELDGIGTWNDDMRQTKARVLAVLRGQ